jgi:hypothetical protein
LKQTGTDTWGAASQGDIKGAFGGVAKGAGQTVGGVGSGAGKTVDDAGKGANKLVGGVGKNLGACEMSWKSFELVANDQPGNTVGGSAGKAVGDTTNNVGKTVSNTTSGLSKTVGDTTGAIGRGDLKGVAGGATGGVGGTVSGAGTF